MRRPQRKDLYYGFRSQDYAMRPEYFYGRQLRTSKPERDCQYDLERNDVCYDEGDGPRHWMSLTVARDNQCQRGRHENFYAP
jgi:hypothetical protein